MSSMVPTRKMSGTGAAGAFALVLVWSLGLAGVDMPVEVAAAVPIVLGFVAGYLIPEA